MSRYMGGLPEHVEDDGGRSAAGFKGRAGDCVARAISIATGRPYREVYARLAAADEGIDDVDYGIDDDRADYGVDDDRKWFKDYMRELGFEWIPTNRQGCEGCDGCDGNDVRLHHDELPPGRLVVVVSEHMVAVIDGVIPSLSNCDSLTISKSVSL